MLEFLRKVCKPITYSCDFYLNPYNECPTKVDWTAFSPLELFDILTEDDSFLDTLNCFIGSYLKDKNNLQEDKLKEIFTTIDTSYRKSVNMLDNIKVSLVDERYNTKCEPYEVELIDKLKPFPLFIDKGIIRENMYNIGLYMFHLDRNCYNHSTSKQIYDFIEDRMDKFIRKYNLVGNIILRRLKSLNN